MQVAALNAGAEERRHEPLAVSSQPPCSAGTASSARSASADSSSAPTLMIRSSRCKHYREKEIERQHEQQHKQHITTSTVRTLCIALAARSSFAPAGACISHASQRSALRAFCSVHCGHSQ